MEPKFQSSFIPKKPVVDSPKMLGPVHKNANIFSVLATFMFLAAFFSVFGVFGYQKYIERQISDQDKKLLDARNAFDEAKIQNLIEASARLESISTLLNNHVAVSQILTMLQKLTLKNVRFTGLSFQNNAGKNVLYADVEAMSYNSIADQRNQLVNTQELSDVRFSNFTLNDKGMVQAKLSAVVLPKLISYKDYVGSTSGTQ